MYSTKSNNTFTLRTSTSDASSALGSFLKDKLPSQPSKLVNNQKIPTGLNYGNYMFWNGEKWIRGGEKIVMGINSGQTSQGNNTIAIGTQSGQNTGKC